MNHRDCIQIPLSDFGELSRVAGLIIHFAIIKGWVENSLASQINALFRGLSFASIWNTG